MKYTSAMTETGRLRHAVKPGNLYRSLCGALLTTHICEAEDDDLQDITCLRCRKIGRRRLEIPW